MTSLIYANQSFSSATFFSSWAPIPELVRSDADTTIIFLTQGRTLYQTPVWDPWFMATTPFSLETDTFGNKILHSEDTPIRIFGCADQFQMCTQAHTNCTSLTGQDALQDALLAMRLDGVQRDIAVVLFTSYLDQSTYENVDYRSLRASDTLSVDINLHPGLPNNQ